MTDRRPLYLAIALLALAGAAFGVVAADYLNTSRRAAAPQIHDVSRVEAANVANPGDMSPNQRVREAFDALREHEGLRFK